MTLTAPDPKLLAEVPGDGKLTATFHTSAGKLVARLFDDKAPATVANFVGLAAGLSEWLDPKTQATVKRPFYDGLAFHRVIPQFMIQGGCPLGQGTGGPGYRFDDEIDASLRHDRGGLLSMANAGPGTNGSQFFVTEVPTPWLDGKHTIFGEVTEGKELIPKIAAAGNGKTKIARLEISRT